MVPIWKRGKSDVTDEEYNEFYKSDFHDFSDPARTIKLHAEGALTYDALLFVPSRAPYDLYSKDFKKGLGSVQALTCSLWRSAKNCCPTTSTSCAAWLIPKTCRLNISRETLQHNSRLRAIANSFEKKIKSELVNMRNASREAYETFFENFGRGLKYGIYTAYGMKKDMLADLLLFYSAREEKAHHA